MCRGEGSFSSKWTSLKSTEQVKGASPVMAAHRTGNRDCDKMKEVNRADECF